MVTISLYQSGGINQQLSFPETWNDLTVEEVLKICQLQLLHAADQLYVKAETLAFIIENRLAKQGIKNAQSVFAKLNPEDVALNLEPLVGFIFKENNRTIQPFPTLQLGKEKLIGPANDFENITCGEFENCELQFYAFAENPSPNNLAAIAAILWRPPNTAYQYFNNNVLVTYNHEKLLPQFLQLTPWQLYAIFTWYCGCKEQLPLKFPTVHEKGEKTNEVDNLIFTKCIHSGAGPKNGSRNQIRITGLLEFMFEMEQEAIKAKELEEKYESRSN